jgi:hypothetical protein
MLIQAMEGGVRVIDTQIYKVRKNSTVTLTDEVGEFQAGGTSFLWGGVTKVGNPNFDREVVNPKGQPIVNTALNCTTKVVDINPSTNQTSVVYELRGGVSNASYPYGVQVPQGGRAEYLITFVFTL